MRRLVGIICALICCHTAHADVKLFENNRWQGPIVLPESADVEEWYAGQNLADWCESVTGRRPEIIEESTNKKTPEIGVFVGRTRAAKLAKITPPLAEGDTAVRSIESGRVYLLGNNPTATRIAVGRFCEQHLGITFAFPGLKGADWAPLKEIPLPGPDTFQPKFLWRNIGDFYTGSSQDWCRLVGYGQSPQFGHTFYQAFSKQHWDADPTILTNQGNGPITPSGNELDPNPNLTHPRAAKIGAEYTLHFLEKNPTEFCAPLGVNDTTDFDRSSKSEGWYRERPVRTDYLIQYLNKVAQEKWQPADGSSHAIGTLAYLHTQHAPTIRANADIFPFVCADRIGYANRDFAVADAENLIAWKKSGVKRLGVYDYWHGSSQCVPRINFTAQSLSIKTASEIGVTAWTAEMGPLWAFDAPKAWLGAKLLIDPSADADELLTKWFKSAYGSGDESMRKAYRIIESAWSRDAIDGGAHQWIRHFVDEDGTRVLHDDEVETITQCLAETERALAKATPSTRTTNQRWRAEQFRQTWELVLSFREVVLARNQIAKTPEDTLRALESLVQKEAKFKTLQEAFNLSWSTTSRAVQWLEFVPTDPRAAWLEMITKNSDLQSSAQKVVKNDTAGLSTLIDFYIQHKGLAATLSAPKDFDAFNRDWNVKLAGNQFSEIDYHQGLINIKNDSGTLSWRTSVKPREIINLAIELGAKSDVQLGLKFNDGKKALKRFVKYGEQSKSVTMLSPKGATEVEFEIVFKDNINLTSIQASRLDPNATP